MTTVAQNPSGCCFTCDDFASCFEDAQFPMTLNLTISGAPTGQREDCCDGGNAYYKKEILWSNLNKTFALEQESPGSTSFCWIEVADCTDHGDLEDNAVLIETLASGTPFGCEGPFNQSELYVYKICASVGCDPTDGKMKLSGVTFACASCSRSFDVPSGQWGDWICGCSPPTCPAFFCADGPDLQTAIPCTGQTMSTRVYWPTIDDVECALDVTCDVTADGTLAARL